MYSKPNLPDNPRCQTANDYSLFWTPKVPQEKKPSVTQRTLVKKVGANESTINFYLKALVEKSWIEMGNFSKNTLKLSYAYLLTPNGVTEKAALNWRFFQCKMADYGKLRGEIEALQIEAATANTSKLEPKA
jgi:EPS-associated MarR family transcriptional regulator